MYENTPLLDNQEQQQAEALDFMAWQQQLEAVQVPVQASPDVQINQPEVAPVADIFEQYGDTVVTIFGVTAALKDLPPCPYGQHSFEARQRFGVKILEKNDIDISDAYAHLRSEPQKQKAEKAEKAEATVIDKHKDATNKSETAKIEPKSVTSERTMVASSLTTEAATDAKILGPEAESRLTSQDSTEAKSSEPSKIVEEAPLTAGGGPDLNELAKEMVDSLDTPRLPNVAILRKRLTDSDPSMSKSTKAVVNLAEHSEAELLPTVLAASAKSLQANETTSEASYEEQMVGLYLEAASEVANNIDSVAPAKFISDEMIADFLGTSITPTDRTELVSVGYYLPDVSMISAEQDVPIESTLNPLSYTPNAEIAETVQAEQPLVLTALPVEVVAVYQKMIDELEPKEAEQLIEMVETMSLIAERLHVLEYKKQVEGKEGQQIIEVLEAYYDQLLQVLEIPINSQSRIIFIEQIRSNTLRKTIAQAFAIPIEGTREFDRDLMKQALRSQGRQQPADRRPINLARIFAMLGIRHDLQDA